MRLPLVWMGVLAPAGVLCPPPYWAQARSVGDLQRPGETAVWAFEQAGQRIGHCASRYQGEVDLAGLRAFRFLDEVLVAVDLPSGHLKQRFRCELWTDAQAHPLRFRLEALVAGSYSCVEAVLSGSKAEATIFQGGKERQLTLDVPQDGYLLANNFVSQIELLLLFAAPAAGEKHQVTLFSANLLQSLPYELEHVGALAEADGGPGMVIKDSLGETLKLDAAGRLLACEVPGQELVLRRVEEAVEPVVIERPTPRALPDLAREEVRIDYEGVSLAGTLTRPKGAEGRLPGLFFVSGSGGQDRDGLSGGIDVGTHEILDRLTLEGFEVLRVDDRGVGESSGPTECMDFDDLIEDARQCVHFLRARADVDPARVALIGHSEGAMTVPILAVRMEGIAAIVLLAAPARPLAELTREQLVAAKRLDGVQEEELEAYDARVRSFLAQVAAGSEIASQGLPPELELLLPARAWLASHARVDPLANILQVRCPILLLQGERDIQVSPERDARPLAAALAAAGHPDSELVVFPGLDHLFKRTVGETSSGLDYLRERPVDPAVLDELSAWLKARLN